MAEPGYIKKLEEKVLLLETQVKHLANDLRLTKEDNETSLANYFEIYSHMERMVEERTQEIKKFQTALEQKGKELEMMLDASPAMIFYKDVEQRFIRVNKKFAKTIGIGINEIIGKKHNELFPKNKDLSLKKDLEVIMNGKPLLNKKEFFETQNGRKQILVDRIPYKDIDRKVVGLIGFALDITDIERAEKDKKELEGQLQQSQRMESIGNLAGGIAHDFNNILSPIMIHSEISMMDLPPDNPIQHNLKEIFKAGERAKDIVKQILAFSRKVEGERAAIKIVPILKEVLKMLRSSIPTTINIHQDLEAESDTIFADRTQVHQIMLNLGINAAHAMREKGGTLKVGLVQEDFDSDAAAQYTDLNPGSYLKLTVSDTGHGIDEKTIKKIFEPYFTTKEVGEGTGMGLSLIHGIVKSHGGNITVESEPGKWTIFNVYLPRASADVSAVEEPSATLPGGAERVLFVDDEKWAVDAMQLMLEKLGYKVTARTSSIEALEVFRNNPQGFDFVITDMTMPNMTGKDLAKELRSIRADFPIILCTGFSDLIDENRAKEMGINAFVMKPIVMGEMANTIREVLDHPALSKE